MARGKTKPEVSVERIVTDKQMRFNPIRTLTAQTLTAAMDAWIGGDIRALAYIFAAVEERDDTIKTEAPKRYKATARHGIEIVIAAGESNNPDALRHKAVLEYFYNNLTAIRADDQNERGGVSLLIQQMMMAQSHRYAPHEIVLQPRNPVWQEATETDPPRLLDGLTAEFRYVPLWFFENRTGKLRFMAQPGALNGVDLEPGGWMITAGDGLLFAAVINYLFKRLAMQDAINYSDEFGKPKIVGKTSAKKGDKEWVDFRNALREISSSGSILVNLDAIIDMLESKQQGELPMIKIAERMDTGITRLYRGGEMVSQAKSGDQAGVTLQEDEKEILETGDAKLITETLNLYADVVVIEWYFGPGTKPLAYARVARPGKKNVDQDLKIDTFLRDSNVPLEVEATAERYGRNIAKPGEPVLQAPKPQPAPTGPDGAAMNAFNELAADLQRLNDNALRQEAPLIAALMAPLSRRVEVMIGLASDAAMIEEARQILRDFPALLKQINDSPTVSDIAKVEANRIAASLLDGIVEAAKERKVIA